MSLHNFFNSLCSYCSIPPTYSSALSKKQPDHYKIKIVNDGREVFVWFEVQISTYYSYSLILRDFFYWIFKLILTRLFGKKVIITTFSLDMHQMIYLLRTALKKINHAKKLGLQKLLGKIVNTKHQTSFCYKSYIFFHCCEIQTLFSDS